MAVMENQMDAIIMTAFPQYKYEDIEGWTLDYLAKIFAMAQWALGTLRGIPLEIDLSGLDGGGTQGLPSPPSPDEMLL